MDKYKNENLVKGFFNCQCSVADEGKSVYSVFMKYPYIGTDIIPNDIMLAILYKIFLFCCC